MNRDLFACDWVLRSPENRMISWSSEPMKLASHLEKAMWAKCSFLRWLLKVSGRGLWDRHSTNISWELVRNAECQLCLGEPGSFPPWTWSIPVLGYAWEAPSWRRPPHLLCVTCSALPLCRASFREDSVRLVEWPPFNWSVCIRWTWEVCWNSWNSPEAATLSLWSPG